MIAPFSVVLASLRAEEPGRLRAAISDDWLQGRSVFGGLQAALALRAMRTLVADAPLRALQATFAAPVPAGPIDLRVTRLRSGKSATLLEARLVDGDGATQALVVGSFGVARPSSVSVTPRQPEIASATAAAPIDFPFLPGITPAFTRHFAARWLVGALPFSGGGVPRQVLELALRDDGVEHAGEAHAVAFADFIPPLALSYLRAPAPGSTVTWMLEMFADRLDQARLPLAGWRVDAELGFARDGYTSQTVMLWGPGGLPVAVSRQSMFVFG